MSGVAFTLIEVAVGLAIMSSAILSVLMLRNSLIKHSHHAKLVARANVLAGRLVGEWENGSISIEVGQRVEGKDETTGLYWGLVFSQQEFETQIFLKCLEVKIYIESNNQEPIVSFEAWLPLKQNVSVNR